MMRPLYIGALSLALLGNAALAQQITLNDRVYDLTKVKDVMSIMEDSRLVRTLKDASPEARRAYQATLHNNVYAPADSAVLQHLQGMEKYHGRRIVIHEFRTPGAEPGTINADRDLRALLEQEPGIWVEVDRRDWEDNYYSAFAERAGHRPDTPQQAQEIAGRYRQLATDRSHVEASLDYSDQHLTVTPGSDGRMRAVRGSTVRQRRDPDSGALLFEADGTPQFVSASRIGDVKAATLTRQSQLKDAEGLGYMYQEKGAEQWRKREAIRQQLKQNTDLDANQRKRLQDLMNMHTVESAVQLRKGVDSLDHMRAAYQRQGYDIGALPQKFEQAAQVVAGVKGDIYTDVAALEKQLQDIGFRDLDDFGDKLRGQVESLKLARMPKPVDRSIRTRMKNAAAGIAPRLPGIAENVMNAYEFYQTAEQVRDDIASGNNLYLDFNAEDTALTKNVKTYGFALLEMTGVPQAMDIGFDADIAEKQAIKDAIARGEVVDPLTSTARVMARVGTRVVKEHIIDPASYMKDQGVDMFSYFVRDLPQEWSAQMAHQSQLAQQQDARYAANVRANDFQLGSLYKRIGDRQGDFIVGPLADNTRVYFHTERNSNWTDAYRAVWKIDTRGKAVPFTPEKNVSAAQADADMFGFVVQDYPAGDYAVSLSVINTADNKLIDSRTETFVVGTGTDQVTIGSIRAAQGDYSGPNLNTYRPNDVVAFRAAPLGVWNENVLVEWFVNSELYKSGLGNQAKINLLKFTAPDSHKMEVALRLREPNGAKILAYKTMTFRRSRDKPTTEKQDETDRQKPAATTRVATKPDEMDKQPPPPTTTTAAKPTEQPTSVAPAINPDNQGATGERTSQQAGANPDKRKAILAFRQAQECYRDELQSSISRHPYTVAVNQTEMKRQARDNIKAKIEGPEGQQLIRREQAGDKSATAIYNSLVDDHNRLVAEIRAVMEPAEADLTTLQAHYDRLDRMSTALKSGDSGGVYALLLQSDCAARFNIDNEAFLNSMGPAFQQRVADSSHNNGRQSSDQKQQKNEDVLPDCDDIADRASGIHTAVLRYREVDYKNQQYIINSTTGYYSRACRYGKDWFYDKPLTYNGVTVYLDNSHFDELSAFIAKGGEEGRHLLFTETDKMTGTIFISLDKYEKEGLPGYRRMP